MTIINTPVIEVLCVRECVICAEHVDPSIKPSRDVQTLPCTCKYIVHPACFNRWFDQRRSCPVCRTESSYTALVAQDNAESTLTHPKWFRSRFGMIIIIGGLVLIIFSLCIILANNTLVITNSTFHYEVDDDDDFGVYWRTS